MHIVFEWTITHLQTSHHAITTHTLIVLAEVYLVSKYWSYFLIELSFAETLEEVTTSKTYPSFLIVKEGSTFLTKPLFPQEREDVAGSAIAPPEFWYRQRSLCPQGAADDSLRNRIAIVWIVKRQS